MKIEVKETDSQPFIEKYINNDQEILEFYDYPLTDEGRKERLKELSSRTFNRQSLVKVLHSFNKRYTACENTFRQISRLAEKDAVAVVGGQQAGLLTGPVYTVNKVLSILAEAERLEEKQGVPVIPVFWIAGEDHDIDEVNHFYFPDRQSARKFVIPEKNNVKIPVSKRKISREEAERLINEALRCLPETEYTKEIYSTLLDEFKDEYTYVDWFALLIHKIFEGTGLVLMDSDDPEIREIEKPFFLQMLKNNGTIREAFYEGASSFERAGFGTPIEKDPHNSHIFIHEQGQRYLMENQGGLFREKNGAKEWTTEELMELCNKKPWLFSNNVVTRPIMQDMLLPVAAFIAGPGEMKYWGVLKQAFRSMGIKMPLIYPRVHISFITRRVEKNLASINLAPEAVLKDGVQEEKEAWFNEQKTINVEEVFSRAEETLHETMGDISAVFSSVGREADQLHKKHAKIAAAALNRYKSDMEKLIQKQHEAVLIKYDETEAELKPDGNLQERHLNIYPYLNMYGTDLLLRVLKNIRKQEALAGKHLFVYL
ncbi:bacillithiol biosynthesis cysteine-adding enzyme BshC [Evansella sp. LMS18]|jgi:bacillithiol biosynthesis cysteine-adding enzyme BshC|uniref:bacillithiol biosynthesis cysteine-adding enzyme BshC n=1 Tax=Evansella sp. LMS18 TaxID=2924033 RepID=UPI0020D0069C|nr:bacillithiol biosynthesis cysteine-adding enzyme BshC [Evansella sp. LMS18]UTR10979.1 bacillithiol biosynthesis cysteine-adding enzyme BshC [Evansella sp. LMS18]